MVRYLRYFIAIAEELHFGRAASRLHITQPALSKQIHRLEAKLGVKLLHRTKRHVSLTTAGMAFLPEARKALQQIDIAVQTAQDAANGYSGRCAIAFTASALHTVLPSILKVFRQRFPQIQLILREQCTLDQVSALHNETVDVGFLHPPIDAPLLDSMALPGEELVVVLPQGHALASQAQLHLSAIARESFILHPRFEGPGLYDQIVERCRKAGFEPHIAHEELKHQTRIGLVAAGMGITFVPASLQATAMSGVIYRSIIESAPTLDLVAAWRKSDLSPSLHNFLDITASTIHASHGV